MCLWIDYLSHYTEQCVRWSGWCLQALLFLEKELNSQWYHEASGIVKLSNWACKSLVLSVRQVVDFLPFFFLMTFIHVPLCYLHHLLHSGFGVRVGVVGWQIFGFFNRSLCLCSPILCIERVVSFGGGVGQMKEQLNEWRQAEWRMWFIKRHKLDE